MGAIVAGGAAVFAILASEPRGAEPAVTVPPLLLASPTEGGPALAVPSAAPVTCDSALALGRAALKTSDERRSLADTARLAELPRAVADASCAARWLALILEAGECNDALDALAGAVFSLDGVGGDDVARVLRANTRCQRRLFDAVAETRDANAGVIDALLHATRGAAADPIPHMKGWLAVGRLERTARELGRHEVATRIDGELASRLAAAREGQERTVFLEAAGNAGCVACGPSIERALVDPRWGIRRAATVALRFRAGKGSVARMCQRALADDAVEVRDQAAWALRWRGDEAAARVECLVTAGAHDPEESVRRTAVASLEALVPHSPYARDGLVHLTGEEHPPDVRKAAAVALTEPGIRFGERWPPR